MPVKNSVTPKKAAVREKKPSAAKLWTLPVALAMLAVGAAGLWFVMRDSSNRPQAATRAAAPMPTSSAESKPAATETSAAVQIPEPVVVDTKAVSITGCLQRADDGFVLKDTQGTDAPKSRSWKSGFLKRSVSSIVLNDKANAGHLAGHVGQRVTVTGPLAGREMYVLSLRRLAPSCE